MIYFENKESEYIKIVLKYEKVQLRKKIKWKVDSVYLDKEDQCDKRIK